jgi:tetratricopeptide (TPR) repeat protein
MAEDSLTSAETLFKKGDIGSILASIPFYIKAVEANPGSYEANWKCARAHSEYANRAFKQGLDGWKDICNKYGKDGMGYAQKAIELEPQRIEGNYWYGLCVKSYSDSVSVFTALKEGLKGSTQKAFETAYEIDKMYEGGGPIKALGRFWYVIPWPYHSAKKSLKYFEEHNKYFPSDPEGLVWYAEALIEKKKKGQAMSLLKKAATSDNLYYSSQAEDLMKELE